MYQLARNLLFRLSAEAAHDIALDVIAAGNRLGMIELLAQSVPSRPRKVMGLVFDNPVGLAAGLDKNADCINGMGRLGFGFIELGTVTPRAQPGNPKPRMFRLVEKQAIINRMGFNNLGIDHLIKNVRRSSYQGVIGINIGKNFDTPIENAVDDYLICLRKAYPYTGYIAINLSSPNTPDLRKLQFGDALKNLLNAIKSEQSLLESQHGRKVPVAVKISPDMTDEEVVEIANILAAYGMDGVIATNTTLSRDAVKGLKHGKEQGGLSGTPLSERSTEVIKILADELSGKLPVIGVGGIDSAAAAVEKMKAGASLVQIYSGFVYKGSQLIREAAEGVYSYEREIP
ncbi:MAG: quinone-dependent dihydroorotate dehydrogenase [Candidatus Endonucleobacter bathymodioli]|uniref:Dihydroorotate dehydrogenase (quinone) n=1 Tax=Candidatus Endonucleibacter bathymodioli TaxID=539814 RepID=A0AA90NTF9_9GAMM|nr:quinone-dependent dihydroorotate dehydrogenase [Candidatus Endonucleobacter bathymodioli]